MHNICIVKCGCRLVGALVFYNALSTGEREADEQRTGEDEEEKRGEQRRGEVEDEKEEEEKWGWRNNEW